jgi:hypothetical protein
MGMKWFWIILAILYVLSRIDLIPDVFVGWGWIDDIVVLILLYRYLARIRRIDTIFQQGGRTAGQQADEHSRTQHSDTRSSTPRTPYEILGISPGASKEEIRAAYRRLANQYHPDKVTHLGKEFQDLADQRFKEIQGAYRQLQ